MLEKFIDVQNVGRFKRLQSDKNLKFKKLNLVFGENGSGKSTIADIFSR